MSGFRDLPRLARASGKYLTIKAVVAAGFILALAIARFNLLDNYLQLLLMLIGINIILTLSLNLVNGYMGEFSVGHAGFMAAGAYVSSMISVKMPAAYSAAWVFPPPRLARSTRCWV